MLRAQLGAIGQFFIVLAFVAAVLSTLFYFFATKEHSEQKDFWKSWARKLFIVHMIAVISVVATLFTIIFNKYYAWDNASLALPLGYAISCFWQDQEGSFLLWMFWNVILGAILIYWFKTVKKKEGYMEAPMMVSFAAVEAFLTSMILGVVIWGDFKLGSSPFLLLKESMPNLPVWKTQPDFVPKDGNGLNPLLQNYWMVIHPPTLFLGFATTLIPFSFAVAGLWKKNFYEWIKMAMPWTLVSAVVLGTGIMMGAIWAYETLNFGGYWNWDPVENAVYVPWLVLVASFHTMLVARKSSSALKATFILSIAQFLLILYSTFLTRSGILGNASVHSFTDLGLSGQLLIYLLTFTLGALLLMAWRWKFLPKDEKETKVYSTEFWVFMGVSMLCLAGFQIIVTTSIPVYNSLGKALGFNLNMAMPTDPLKHYTVFQMWLFVGVLVLTAVAQYFYWRKIKGKNWAALMNPLIVTLLLSAVWIVLAKVNNWQYIVLLTTAVFSLVANFTIFLDIFKGNIKVAGGAVTHMGVALMLIGIMFSSAYEKTISINYDNEKIFKEEKENRNNVLLYLNNPVDMKGFSLKYGGEFVDIRNVPGYVEKKFIQPVANSTFKLLTKTDILDGEKIRAKKGDTLEYEAENTYYQINYTDKEGRDFNLYPRFQKNEQMGGQVASPAIKKFWDRDIYTHVNYVTTGQEKEWSMPENFAVAIGDTFFLNDYVAILDKIEPQNELEGMPLSTGDIAAKAQVRILNRDGEKMIYPVYAIKDGQVWAKPVVSPELGIRAQLIQIDPATGKFTFSIARGDKEYIVLKAIEKPHINLLWLGTGLLVIGISLAGVRRFRIDLKTT
jgi:cytochrome c-type biogenesis protein CcmF